MTRFASVLVLMFAVACDEEGHPMSADATTLERGVIATAAAGGFSRQVGPFCNETCPDDAGLADACEDEDPNVTCIPSVNEGHGSECWVEEYEGSTSCPSGYVVQCSCWSTVEISLQEF